MSAKEEIGKLVERSRNSSKANRKLYARTSR